MITVNVERSLKLNPVSSFKVAIYDMKVVDVINRDALIIGNKKIMGSDAGDPYVIINFDNIHTAHTKYISGKTTAEFPETYYMDEDMMKDYNTDSPANSYEHKDWYFMYETKYPKKLDKKYLSIVARDHDMIGKDDLIGEARVDLMTLAAGPVEHDLVLWDGDIEAGHVQFKLKMKQITCPVLRFDDFVFPNGKSDSFYIRAKFNNKPVKIENSNDRISFEKECLSISNTSEPATLSMELKNVSFETLYKSKVELGVYRNSRELDPVKRIIFSMKKILYSDAISVDSATLIGPKSPFNFTLRAYGLPFYAQMKSGIQYDYEVKDGVLFADNILRLPIPHFSKKEVVNIEITEEDMNPMVNDPPQKK